MKLHTFIFLCISLLLGACSSSPTEADAPPLPRASLEEVVLGMMEINNEEAQALTSYLTGMEARLVKYDRIREMLYFSMPPESRKQIGNICRDTSTLVSGDHIADWKSLDGVMIPADEGILVRFEDSLFQVDPDRMIEKGLLSLSVQEFYEMSINEGIYNGPILFATELADGTPAMIMNHSAPIAYQGNEMLTRLANKIVSDPRQPEQSAQELLDYVTREITWEDHQGQEIIMRPHEIIFLGRADCSGTVVLYASLLAQLDIPHLLLYLPGHVSVAVGGTFGEENGLTFEHEGRAYSWAETTDPGFVIGKTKLAGELGPAQIEQIQLPGQETRLFDVRTGDSLDFVTATVSRPVR